MGKWGASNHRMGLSRWPLSYIHNAHHILQALEALND